MKSRFLLAAAVLVVPALMAGGARAQDPNSCATHVVVNAAYSSGTGVNQYEHYVVVQNRTNEPRTFTLSFSGFPQDVTLFSPTFPGPVLRAWQQQDPIRYARGTRTNNLTLGNVEVVYDGPPAADRPTIRVTNCVARN